MRNPLTNIIGDIPSISCDAVCMDGEIRLVGGRNENEGRLEVCINGVWGYVCDNNWSELDGQVVCNELGINTTGMATVVTWKVLFALL